MSPLSKTFASSATIAALSSPASAQGVLVQKNVSLAMAKTGANAAMAQCQSTGFKVSVVVFDRDGLPIVMLRGDDSGSLGKDDACSQAGIDKVADQLKWLRRLTLLDARFRKQLRPLLDVAMDTLG